MGNFEDWVKERERERKTTKEEEEEIRRIRRQRRKEWIKKTLIPVVVGYIILVLLRVSTMR